MQKKLNKLIKSKFVRNVTIMATGTAGAQVITLISSPVITRLYGPEAFGIMGTFSALINLIIPIAALTYPIAIVLPKKHREAKDILNLSLIVTGILALLSLLIIITFNENIINLFNLEEIAVYLYLLPFVVISSGVMQVANQWLIRTRQFSINARVTFWESIITNGGKVVFGFLKPLAAFLVFFTSIRNGIRAAMMIFFADKTEYKRSLKDDSQSIKTVAKKYRDFPLYRAPESFISAVSGGLPVLMLTSFFGPAAAGFYSIGRTVLSLPSQLIGKAVGDVFYPRITEAAHNNENIARIIKKATLGLSLIGVLPYGLVILFGPELFGLVFGSDWVIAGEYARWISLWTFTSFINRPAVHSLAVLNAQKFHLLYTIIMLVTRLVLLSIGFYVFSSDLLAVSLFSISGAILNVGLILITLKMSEKRSISN